MFEITYSSKNFPPSYGSQLTGTNTIQADWPELVWAALSVGKAEIRHLTRHGVFSWYELLMRLYILRVNFRESLGGELTQTEVYKALDPSEKNAISYFMGLTMAKLLSNRFLDVPWLIHLDSFDKTRLAFGSTKRPDLLGHNRHHQWLIMEAKGRSGRVEPALMPKALRQTLAVDTVDKASPFLRVASASFIKSKKSGILTAQWGCPVGNSIAPGVKLEMSTQDFLNQYYELFRNLLNGNNQGATGAAAANLSTVSFVSGRTLAGDSIAENRQEFVFRTASFPEFDIQIGLLDQGNDFLLKNPTWYDNLFALQNDANLGPLTQGTFIAPDGVLVQLGQSWNTDNMRKEPSERTNR